MCYDDQLRRLGVLMCFCVFLFVFCVVFKVCDIQVSLAVAGVIDRDSGVWAGGWEGGSPTVW